MFIVGPDGVKGSILTRLARGRTIRFSDFPDASYFEQLVSERRVVRYVRGSPLRRFERISGRRTESLDCLVYAFAVRSLAPLDPARWKAELRLDAGLAKPSPVIPSAWLTKGARH